MKTFPLGSNAVLKEVTTITKFSAPVSGSPMVKEIAAVGMLTAVVWSEIGEMVGAAFTTATVSVAGVLVTVPNALLARTA